MGLIRRIYADFFSFLLKGNKQSVKIRRISVICGLKNHFLSVD